MAKATYKCPECGATITVTGHNRNEADRKAAYMEAQGYTCFSCKCKQEHEEAEKKAGEMGLPALEGSPKQIAWAESIRMKFLEMNLSKEAREWMLSHTSARFFIDNRETYQMVEAFKHSMEKKEETKPVTEPAKKTEWRKFEVNIQNIDRETDRAYLVNMPHSSEYDGFSFWIAKKLCRGGSHSYAMQISVIDTMEFKLQRKGKRGNVLEEKTISAESMIEAFGGECSGKSWSDEVRDREEIINHVPETLTVEKVAADAALVR